MTQNIWVKVPQMGKFQAELEVVESKDDKKLVKTWQGIFKEFTKHEEGYYEETGTFREIPDDWKWEVRRDSVPRSLKAVG